jgi:cytochrome bd-type quinol oxidase subunit 2
MKGRVALIVGGVLMILLGIARGAGGIVLLTRGPSADPAIQAKGSAVALLGALLVILGAALVVTAVAVLRKNRRAWLLGIWLVIAFVIDGALNGFVFFGKPRDQGTLVNLIAAALIVSSLLLGRSALHPEHADQQA